MSTPSSIGMMERFLEDPTVTKARTTVADAIAPLNDALTTTTDAYDSMVVFSHVPHEAVAVPLTHRDAEGIEPHRTAFRDKAILGRRVLLKGTALEKDLIAPTVPRYRTSTINRVAPQQTYTHPLFHGNRPVGALQYSFTPPGFETSIGELPNVAELVFLASRNRQELDQAAAEIGRLQALSKELGSLATSLEFDEPVAPNAYIVRWDINNSTAMVEDERHQAFDALNNQLHLYIRHLAQSYQSTHALSGEGIDTIYSDQGDGAYIILPTGEKINPYAPEDRDRFRADVAAPFLGDLRDGIATISRPYERDLQPRISISGDFGYVEPNSVGRLTSRTMYTLAKQKKQ